MTGMRSGGVKGTPFLHEDWVFIKGYLVGPGADLRGADLSGGDLGEANLTETDLSTADLTGIRSSNVRAFPPPSLPSGWFIWDRRLLGPKADLRGQEFDGTDFHNMDLDGLNLAGVTSSGITGTPARLPSGWTLVAGTLVFA